MAETVTKSCTWDGGKCQKPADTEVQIGHGTKWYPTCDTHLSWARRSESNYRDIATDHDGETPQTTQDQPGK